MDTPSIPESQSHHHLGPGASAGPQIRSRVTVVCAECKRLKLKCDRRTPCSSCTKRDTVARCVYSPAAAEKIDLHSLNNRLIQVESQLAQFTAPGARSHQFYNHPPASTHSDRALLAVGHSGSSLAISLDDISTIWLDELGLGKDILPVQPPPAQPSCPAYAPPNQVKVEPAPVTLPEQDSYGGSDPPVHLLLPPLSAYYTSSTPTASEASSATPRLIAYLPFAPRKRQKLYDNVEDILRMHPCFNFKHFKDRAEAMFKWASEVEGNDGVKLDSSSSSQSGLRPSTNGGSSVAKETARAIFFGSSAATPTSVRTLATSKPTISFFAAVAAAFALGTLVDREIADEEARLGATLGDGVALDDSSSSSRPPSRKKSDFLPVPSKRCKGVSKDVSSPAVLFALSQQALSMFEKSSPYDLDFLTTMILHVLYALHDSKARVTHSLLPDVGKMVNIARTMGLDMDPDEFPGTFSLFEAESRRRLWWDIFYYDLFVSDYMGRTPLISDMEHTTRLPMDVDEDVFTPACTSIPLPRSPLSPLEPNSSDFKYFGLKCRLAQLVKDIKKRSLRDCVRNDLAAHEQFTLEQAVSCANEIKQWLADLPSAFRLDIPSDLPNVQGSHSQSSDAVNSSPPSANPSDLAAVSPILLAQRCELAITAHRLIMKVYVPFLRPSYGHGDSTSYYQATVGAFTAAHSIIHSLRVLCWMWKQRPDLKGRRPMPALFNFYSFGRALFDAAVACVHNVIKDPTSVWVHIAVEDVNYALEVMRDPMLNTGRGSMRGGIEGTVHEAVKIVELLQKKAEGVRAGNSDAAAAGIKRKYDDLEVGVQRLHKDFQFPFVGVPVASGGSSVHPPSSTVSSSAPCPRPLPSGPGPNHRVQNTSHANPAEEQSKHVPLQPPVGPKRGSSISSDGSKCKDKHTKKPPYPQTGIRVRPGKEPSPFSMLRTSLSSAAVKPSANSEVAMPPAPLPPSRAPSVVSTPNLEHPPYHQSSPFAQITQTTSSPSSVMNMHHSSTPLSSDGTVDFTLPFGAADQVRAQTQMDIDLSQPGRYGVADMDQNVTNSQQFSKVSPPIPSYEQTHNAPYNSSSPASYAPSSGSYSNLSSPYTNNGPQFSNGPPPPHDQRSAPFDMSASMQNYYPYGPRYQETANVQPHPVSLVTVDVEPPISMNHGGEDPQFQIRDSTVSREGSVFQYQHDKSHLGMYAMKPPERHASMPQSPFPESHNQPMTQPWHQETAALHENSGFWRSYD